jgi:hypothetical protein
MKQNYYYCTMKKNILLIIFVLSMITANAQTNWTFSSGIGFMFAPAKTLYINEINANKDTSVYQYKIIAQGFSFFMYPKYHFVEAQSKSRSKSRRRSSNDDKPYDFSVGIPFMLGFGGIFSNGNGNTQTSFMYTAAAMADINFGGCRANSETPMGAYIGVGFGAANTSQAQIISDKPVDKALFSNKYKTVTDIYGYTASALGVGPQIHAGFEYGTATQNKFGLHVGYQPSVNKNGLNYYIIGLQIPFSRGFNMF